HAGARLHGPGRTAEAPGARARRGCGGVRARMSGGPGGGRGLIGPDAFPGDLPALPSLYAPPPLPGLASFEEVPPDAAEMERRYRDIVARRLPYVVVESGGRVAGYAYAGPYRTRPAYRYTVEDSVYIAPDAVGRGLGRAALSEVIRQ